MKKIAVIRMTGMTRKNAKVADTLDKLRLKRKFACVVVEDTPSIMGMIKKVGQFITYGEINDETLKLLIEKRGEINPEDKKKTKPFFRLHPPTGGFERKGTKELFSKGGALGSRGEKINDLLKRMI